MSIFGSKAKTKAASTKIDASTAQVLELETQKKRLEMERDQIQLELDNQKKRNAMALEQERHTQKLDFDEKKAVFAREKAVWETDRKALEERTAREKEEFEKRTKSEHELKLTEATALVRLDSQQKVKQAELDRDRAITELRTKHAEELSKVKSDLAQEYYERMTKAFSDIQTNGTQSTKFVQELALKMFDSVPRAARTEVDVSVGHERPVALPAAKSA